MHHKISEFFKVFSDPTRLSIIEILLEEELCVQDIAKRVGISPSATSHQLKTLKMARVVKYEKIGKSVYYSLDDDHVHQVYKIALEHISHD